MDWKNDSRKRSEMTSGRRAETVYFKCPLCKSSEFVKREKFCHDDNRVLRTLFRYHVCLNPIHDAEYAEPPEFSTRETVQSIRKIRRN
jgi:hypothetical protein